MISGQTRAKKNNYAELSADYFGAKAGNVFQCFYRKWNKIVQCMIK